MNSTLHISSAMDAAIKSVLSIAHEEAAERYIGSTRHEDDLTAGIKEALSNCDVWVSLEQKSRVLEVVICDRDDGFLCRSVDLEAMLQNDLEQFEEEQIDEIVQALDRMKAICKQRLNKGGAA